MTSKRDRFVDFFKGVVILWVIHIHTVYWSGRYYIPDIIRQVSLTIMDVPIFFFISGYLTKPSNLSTSIQKSLRQFIRIYSQYIIISFLIYLIFLLISFVLHLNTNINLISSIISTLQVNPSGLVWGNISVYRGSLWYLQNYLALLPFVAISAYLLSFRKWQILTVLSPLVIYSLSVLLLRYYPKLPDIILSLFFYLFIYLLGTIYKIKEQNIRTKYLIASLAISVALVCIVFYVDDYKLLIQKHKFPPTFSYLAYSLIQIHTFIILKRLWKYQGQGYVYTFFEWCGKNVFYIYLFQGAVCSLPFFFVKPAHAHIHTFILYWIVLLFNICGTLLVTYQYINTESYFLSLLKPRQSENGKIK